MNPRLLRVFILVTVLLFLRSFSLFAQEPITSQSLQLFSQPLAKVKFACKSQAPSEPGLIGKLSAPDLLPGITWKQLQPNNFIQRLRARIRESSGARKRRLKQKLSNFRAVVSVCRTSGAFPPPATPTVPGGATPTPTPPSLAAFEPSDWDLMMMRLVNRARRDPSGEASRINSAFSDTRSPLAPLAYNVLVAKAALNHNSWMHTNLGRISSNRTPDSFSHFETMDGQSTGASASSTTNFTGVRVGERLTFVGYRYSNWGENILTDWSSAPLFINEAAIRNFHKRWWESSGHRNNFLSSGYTTFGFFAEVRGLTPPLGGINAPANNILFATQVLSRPQSSPLNHIFGLLYKDKDLNGAWTPKNTGDAQREGISHAVLEVFAANTQTVVASTETLQNGSFSIPLADGIYDLLFSSAQIGGGSLMVGDVQVSAANADAGDIKVP